MQGMTSGWLKRALGILGLFVFTLAVPVAARAAETDLGRAMVQVERKRMIELNMGLTMEEAKEFWPLYRQYEVEIGKLYDRQIQLIKNYVTEYDGLDDERSIELLREAQDIQREELKIRKKYVKRFKKVLPPKKVVRYYQIENKLDAIIDFELAAEIPLISE